MCNFGFRHQTPCFFLHILYPYHVPQQSTLFTVFEISFPSLNFSPAHVTLFIAHGIYINKIRLQTQRNNKSRYKTLQIIARHATISKLCSIFFTFGFGFELLEWFELLDPSVDVLVNADWFRFRLIKDSSEMLM